MSARHDMRQLVRDAIRAGLTLQHSNRGHPRLVDPRSGRFVVISNTPRSSNATHCVRRDLRRLLGVAL